MADVLNLFAGPCTVYVDGVNVGWTRGGLRMRVNKSMWGRPSLSGLGVDEIIKQSEDYYVSTILVETTIANIRKAWGINESAVGLKVNFGGSTTIPVHTLQFVSSGAFFEAYFYRVVAVDFGEIALMKEKDASIPVTFRAILDTTKSVGAQIGYIVRGPRGYSSVVMRVTVPKYQTSQLQSRVAVYYTSATSTLLSRVVSLNESSKDLILRLISRANSSDSLTVRLIVPKLRTEDIRCRLTVYYTPVSSPVVMRVTVRSEATKDLIVRATIRNYSSKDLVARTTVAFAPGTSNVISRLTVFKNSSKDLISRATIVLGAGTSNLVVRLTSLKESSKDLITSLTVTS